MKVAGSRWRTEEAFQSEKGLVGLDEHQVRRYPSWIRWVTLAMLAHAFLSAVRADEHARTRTPDGLVPLSCNEIQRLFNTLVQPLHHAAHQLGWSDGAAVIRGDLAPAITGDKPRPAHEDHDVPAEC